MTPWLTEDALADEVNYAEKVVALCLDDPKYVGEVRAAVLEDYILSKELRQMYLAVLGYHDESHGQIPTRQILLDILNGSSGMDQEAWGTLYDRVWEAHVESDVRHLTFYAQRLEDGWRAEVIKRNVLDAVENLKKRDVNAAVESLYKEWPRSRNQFNEGSFVDDVVEVYEELDTRAKSPKLWEGVRMGFPSLDDATGGHCRGELIVVIGGTGVGKSLVLGQIGINVARQGKRVLLVTVENSKWSYMNRLYSNVSGVPYYKFKRHKMEPSDKSRWLQSVDNLNKDYCLRVVEFSEGCSARDVAFYLRQQDDEFDYVIVDQITNMMPNDPKDHKAMSWQWFGQISLDLKRLAGSMYHNKGIPVLSAAQAAGGTVGKKEFTTDDVAMGKIILHHAHAGLFITKVEEGVYNMGASKWRDAKVDIFPVYPDFSTWSLSEDPGIGGSVAAPPLQLGLRSGDGLAYGEHVT